MATVTVDEFCVEYDRLWPLIVSYLHARQIDYATAEDIAAQAFMNAYQALDRYEDRGLSFKVWLFRITRNTMASWFRKRHTQDVQLEFAENMWSEDDPLPDDELEQAINSLTRHQQAVIVLRFYRDMSYEEVSQHMGILENAVRQVQYRALANLRAKLGAA